MTRRPTRNQPGFWPDACGIAGVDEAGRGPLAGPLLVAAVILHPERRIDGLNDSKQLSEAERERLFPMIIESATAFAIIEVSVNRIDQLNIFQATMAGMREAVLALPEQPECIRVDGNKLPKQLPVPAEAIVKGDAHHAEIAAASILAKVSRDRLMLTLDQQFPDYGFGRHKGYPTPEHLAALQAFGPCACHRRSYAPVRALLAPALF
ncbi:ribonuclease HII [Ahniella affigens]|uniref:Ribonuclease HII n=1 Tax=Ahniella affigens TaxID=2021234 RepID=A0A2P1PMI8_9GAMM|nr:ribonuclease HII [Ahniella affigens]AVP96058.1 ribonuclease HII [Ahniella affigens]